MTLKPSNTIKRKFYCKYCRCTLIIEIPDDLDLLSPSGNEFVGNTRCVICKNVGYLVS